MVAADEGEQARDGPGRAVLLNQVSRSLVKERKDVFLDGVDGANGFLEHSLDQVLRTGRGHELKLDAGALSDLPEDILFVGFVKGNADAFAAGTTGTARAVDVALGVKRRLAIDDQVHERDVQTTREDVGADQDLDGALAKALHGALAQALRDIAVQDGGSLEAVVRAQDIGLGLGQAENDGRAASAKDVHNVGNQVGPALLRRLDLDVSDVLVGPVLIVAHQVFRDILALHELVDGFLDRIRHGRREKQGLVVMRFLLLVDVVEDVECVFQKTTGVQPN